MLPLNQIFLSQNLKGNQWGTQSNEWSAPGERGTATTNRYVSELSIALDTSQQLRNKPENKGRLHYQSDLLQHFHLSPSFRLAEFGPSTCAVTKALIRAYPEEVRWEIAPSNFHIRAHTGETIVAVWKLLTCRLLLSLWHKLLLTHQTWVWSRQNYFHHPSLERRQNLNWFIYVLLAKLAMVLHF